jgi:hypothetical protein
MKDKAPLSMSENNQRADTRWLLHLGRVMYCATNEQRGNNVAQLSLKGGPACSESWTDKISAVHELDEVIEDVEVVHREPAQHM